MADLEWIGTSSVETPLELPTASSRSRPWNWAAIGLIGLAQAAAVLLAVGLTWHSSTKSESSQLAVASHSPLCRRVVRRGEGDGLPSVPSSRSRQVSRS